MYIPLLKHSNIHAHISPFNDFITKNKSKPNKPNITGIQRPPKIIFQCDSFVGTAIDSYAIINVLSDIICQDTTGNLFHIIAGQFDFPHPSITKIVIQFHENSDFENHCKDFKCLEDTLNEILIFNEQLVTMHIIPRVTVHPPM